MLGLGGRRVAVAGAWALTSGIGPLETARTALFIAPLPRTEDLSLFPSSQLLSAKMGSSPKKGWGPGLTGSPDRIYLDAETQASDLPRSVFGQSSDFATAYCSDLCE